MPDELARSVARVRLGERDPAPDAQRPAVCLDRAPIGAHRSQEAP